MTDCKRIVRRRCTSCRPRSRRTSRLRYRTPSAFGKRRERTSRRYNTQRCTSFRCTRKRCRRTFGPRRTLCRGRRPYRIGSFRRRSVGRRRWRRSIRWGSCSACRCTCPAGCSLGSPGTSCRRLLRRRNGRRSTSRTCRWHSSRSKRRRRSCTCRSCKPAPSRSCRTRCRPSRMRPLSACRGERTGFAGSSRSDRRPRCIRTLRSFRRPDRPSRRSKRRRRFHIARASDSRT